METKKEVIKDKKPKPIGITTVLKLLDKPFLVTWANKLGFKGIDVTENIQKSAKQGDLIHKIIQSHLTKEEVDLTEYSEEDIVNAERAFLEYLGWENMHTLTNIEIEKPLTSWVYGFWGKLDLYCQVDGLWTIIDFKTSKKVNDEQIIQVSCYEQLVRENGLKVDQILIINVGKYDYIKCEIINIPIKETSKYLKYFLALLNVYKIKEECGL